MHANWLVFQGRNVILNTRKSHLKSKIKVHNANDLSSLALLLFTNKNKDDLKYPIFSKNKCKIPIRQCEKYLLYF